ncbi:Small ribosomal subunit protein bS6 - like 1 [Theobroma cacao]|uniref:Translation elongation factor EF1B/ribosomal protein S6 family protein isoform 1 n=2 Tax=Theobroma cacao TaxID=3641 RepID=A0A061FYU7_THECC|nr:Translation elongation factor EF1B/ribosomal protein S6 family protein isoform 1 [Theobroma cacao]WRX11894.1 Small ribosomal subunit protein bS6 - like 1 [Theobroma cacao]
MPLYDCVLLFKPHVQKELSMDLIRRVGKHVCSRNGVLTEMKSFGTVQLGYGIRKLDGRYYQGQLMQMTMMATPNFNKELHYLNKEDRLLRWLLVKHRDTKHGLEFLSEEDGNLELSKLPRGNIFNDVDEEEDDDEDEDEDDDDDDDDDEYDENQENSGEH